MRKKWILWVVPVLCIAVIAAAMTLWLQNHRYTIHMELQGQTSMAVEVGTNFDDPGAECLGTDMIGADESITVKCEGTVDTAAVGVYRLSYRAEFHGHVATAYRDVHVVESLAPVITLTEVEGWYTLPGDEYQEEGFTATDWYDGDITDLVIRKVEANAITYTVTNSAGRTTTVRRDIHYEDPLAPEVTLLGGETITVSAGQPFLDPGFTAFDNADGDMTNLVQVAGSVDIYRPGDYTLTYTVTDSFGNTTAAERTVTVEITQTNPGSSTGKIIYLTFDDGPSNYTAQLLDILAKYDVKASFFLVNTGNIGIATRIAEEGHTVAIHTATHNFAYIYSSEDAYYADLYRMQGIIADLTGQTSYLMRFPGGSSNSVSAAYNKGIMTRLVQSVRERGFRYFDWNVDSNDAGGAQTAEEVFQNVIQGVEGKNTAIVLQHDTKQFSVEAVERIIIWGLANGYTFLPLTESSPSCAHGVYN